MVSGYDGSVGSDYFILMTLKLANGRHGVKEGRVQLAAMLDVLNWCLLKSRSGLGGTGGTTGRF